MQDSSAFQYLAIDTIHESATNPRVTFDPARLEELAASIRKHVLIQPITVRPNSDGFEIVAGARRFRAAQMAELFSVPVHIVDINDAHALELALAENVLRADVHPYEEAAGLRRLLDMPGYDVATLPEKFGKSASHIYARLPLLQLIPEVAQAFTQERITASHANLIARLPQESQAAAFEQCWRKDWQDKEPHLLPANHVAAWIQANLYLSLGLPEEYRLPMNYSDAYHLMGDGVAVPVVRYLARYILEPIIQGIATMRLLWTWSEPCRRPRSLLHYQARAQEYRSPSTWVSSGSCILERNANKQYTLCPMSRL